MNKIFRRIALSLVLAITVFFGSLPLANSPSYAFNQSDVRRLQFGSRFCAECDLSGADLSNANLNEARIFKSNLSNANLSNANLSNAHLFETDLTGAKLENARLEGVILFGSTYDERTTWPRGFRPESQGARRSF